MKIVLEIKDIENIEKKKKTFDMNQMFGLWKKELLQKKKSGKKRGVIKVVLCDTDVIIEFFKGNVSTKNIWKTISCPKILP